MDNNLVLENIQPRKQIDREEIKDIFNIDRENNFKKMQETTEGVFKK